MDVFPSKWKPGLLAACLLSLSLSGPGCAVPASKDAAASLGKDVQLRQSMRKLWEDHITFTRLVIVSSGAGLPDLEANSIRLLQNQADIGDAMKPYYGEDAGDRLAELLRLHILGAVEVLAAAKADDSARLEAAREVWYANSDEVATFLSGANPAAWPLPHMKEMLREHLDLTLTQAVNQLQGRYAESVRDYDKVHEATLGMSDMLSAGIISQFPKQF